MVHAWVGQKLLKNYIFKRFLVSRSWTRDTVPTSTNAIWQPLLHIVFCQLDPPTNYILTFLKPFSLVWYVIPLLKTGFLASTVTFSYGFDDENIKKNCRSHVRTMLLGVILTRWRQPVASIEALDLLHWVMCKVMYRRIAMAIKMAIFACVFVDCCLYACCPGSRWGDTEQVVTQCRGPVASVVALDTLHRAMLSVLLRHIRKAFKIGCDRGAFRCHRQFCHQP